MNRFSRLALSAILFVFIGAGSAFAQAASPSPAVEVTKKKDVAVFALGYYGYSLPAEVLGPIDSKIMKVFVDMGRFNVIGQTQRFTAADVNLFMKTIKASKEANFVLPDEFAYGEKAMTMAEFNKLIGAFFIAIPVVTKFDSSYDSEKKQYSVSLEFDVTFINAADEITYGIAHVSISKTSKVSMQAALDSVVNGIPDQLTYEIRKIPIFQITTQILAVNGSEVKIQLGQDMGIKPGYEFVPVYTETYGDVSDEVEMGLIGVQTVGTGLSTGYVFWSDQPLKPGMTLKEVPRLGFDLVGALGYNFMGSDQCLSFDLRVPISSMGFNFRLMGGISAFFADGYPLGLLFGAEYNILLGRLSLTAWGELGLGVNMAFLILDPENVKDYLRYGVVNAGLGLSYLVNRDLKVFAEAGFVYYLDILGLSSPWGVRASAGIAYKL